MNKNFSEPNTILYRLQRKVAKAKLKIFSSINCTVIDYNLNPNEINHFNYENEKYVLVDNIKISREKAQNLYSALTSLEVCSGIEEKKKIIKQHNLKIPFILRFNNRFWTEFQQIINEVKKC